MAKPPGKPADDAGEQGTSLALQGVGTEVTSFEPNELEGLSGLGYSEKTEDNLVPILGILQDNSAEVKRGHAKMIEGAQAGNLIMRSLKKVINVDSSPIPVIPCGFTHYWVEWNGEPGEGSVVRQYPFDDRPAEAKEVPDPTNEERTRVVMPNGNRLVDTRYWYLMALIDGDWKQVVAPMAGTNHTVSRSWNSIQKEKRLPVEGRPKAPSWFFVYGLKTHFNQRGQQSWYTFEITELGWNQNKELRDQGRTVFEMVQQGEIEADVREDSGTVDPASRPNPDAI